MRETKLDELLPSHLATLAKPVNRKIAQLPDPNQLQIDLDFYSETVKKANQNNLEVFNTAKNNERIAKELVREPMRLLRALTNLTVVERRLYWLVLRQIRNIQYQYPDRLKSYNALTFYFHPSEIFDGATKWSSNYVMTVLQELRKRSVEWQNDEGTLGTLAVFHTAVYTPGQSTIMLQLNPNLTPGFLELGNNFAQFELTSALKLTSEYAQLLYTNLSRYAYRGTWVIDLVSFKQIVGASSKSYEEFSNVRLRILDPAMEQICQYTELDVSYQTMGIGRRVTSLAFKINFKEVKSAEISRQIKETMKQKLKETLEIVGGYSLEEKLTFVHDSLRDYYPEFTPAEKHKILSESFYLDRFCTAESYISTGHVARDKQDAYMRKSVFFPDQPGTSKPKKGENK